MDFIAQNWFLFSVAIIAGVLLFGSKLYSSIDNNLSAAEAVQLLNKFKVVIVDTRDAEEFAKCHILGAKNIRLEQLEAKIVAIAKDKSNPILLYGKNAINTKRVMAALYAVGYKKIHTLAGGLPSWQAAELPIEKSA